jgi:hypothetical protein
MVKRKVSGLKGYGKEDYNKEEVVKIYFCPKCKSHNVRYIFGVKNLLGLIPKQKCFDCGFESNGFPLLVTTKGKIQEAKEKLKKKAKKLNKSRKKK